MGDIAESYWEMMYKNQGFEKNVKNLIDSKKINKEMFISAFTEIENAFLEGWKPEDEE
jgi:hypothetical protein